MERNTENSEGAGPDAAQQRNAADQLSGDSAANSPCTFPPNPCEGTSQAERAVMHPEHHDAEWRYYHTAWHS